MSQPNANYVPALDGLRALAVAMVVLYHAGATSGLPGLAPGGFIGVSVFFTISGYLVTSLLLREAANSGSIDVARFWSRRLKRLWPASLVVVTATIALASTYWSGMRSSDAVAGVFGYTNWHVIGSGSDQLLRTIVGPLGPFWSLAIEEQFYLLLTIAVLASLRTARPVRTLGIVVVVGWLASLATQIPFDGPQYRLEFGTDTRGAEILAGCGLAILLHERTDLLDRSRRWLEPAGSVALVAIVLLAATTDYRPPWLLHGGYPILSLVTAILVVSLLVPNRLAAVLARRPLVRVGMASYSLYLCHWPVILILTPDRTGLDGWTLVAVKIAAAAMVAAVLHLTVEQPLRRAVAPARTVVIAWMTGCVTVSALALIVL
jgi:peptidoglycan/LPS O-acetylase OafA/YrhL